MNMVERVAHALSGVVNWNEVSTGRQEHFRTLAVAAIEAMRTPTWDMELALRKAVEAGLPGGRFVPPPILAAHNPSACRDSRVVEDHNLSLMGWNAMIDAALREANK